MSLFTAPQGRRVWIDEGNCKGCDICVGVCPSGTLTMVDDDTSPLGNLAKVAFEDSCIGCNECELHCPDFAIFVASKKDDGVQFAKLTEDAKTRAEKIKANHYQLPKEYEAQADLKEGVHL